MKILKWLAVASALYSTVAFADRSDHVFEGEFYKQFSTLDFFEGALHTGSYPKGANFSPDGKWLYVANMYSAYTTVVDLKKLKKDNVLKTDNLFASSEKVRQQMAAWLTGFPQIDSKSQVLGDISILQNAPNIVSEIATPYGHNVTKAQSIEVSFSANSRFAFVSQMETSDFKNGGRVTVFDTSTKDVIAEIPTHGMGSKIIGVSKKPDAQGRVIGYVTNWFTRSTSVIDLSPKKLEALAAEGHNFGQPNPELYVKSMKIPSAYERKGKNRFGIASRGVAFANDGNLAIITNYDSRSVFLVNAQTHQAFAELPPVPERLGGPSAMRHVVINKDDSLAYISMMGRNAIIKIDLVRLRSLVVEPGDGSIVRPSDSIWDQVLLPWGGGQKNLRTIYLSDEHTLPSSARGGISKRANPNTIILDPVDERYLYVSNRTTDMEEGKLDVIDTLRGKVIFSLGAGKHPTALALSPDGCMLISSEFEKRRLIRFYDTCALTDAYERLHD